MNADTSAALYSSHLAELRRRYDDVLDTTGVDAIVLGAGQPHKIFFDDQHLPYKPNPHLLQWGPLLEHPGSALLYRQGQTPVLFVYTPDDFWHRLPAVPDLLSTAAIDIQPVTSVDPIRNAVGAIGGTVVFVGETLSNDDSFGISECNPAAVITALNEYRTVKTAWEVNNISLASELAVRGHLAAEQCFAGGGSEYEIHLAFRTACGVTDNEMPYPAIVALNDHAATLHYQRLDRDRGPNLSLLIDAGCNVSGYASDITRTHSDDAEFGALIEAMHELQRTLCTVAQPDVDYRELHLAAHHGIADLLREAGIVSASAAETVERGISRVFFPHGLGHFLGLQVHDVGALYTRRGAGEAAAAGEDPYLRLTRVLQPGNVLTIEPGLYFIDSLMQELRSKAAATMIDWQRIEQLRPYGGIRIEDNLLITADGNRNLTREAFANFDL